MDKKSHYDQVKHVLNKLKQNLEHICRYLWDLSLMILTSTAVVQ